MAQQELEEVELDPGDGKGPVARRASRVTGSRLRSLNAGSRRDPPAGAGAAAQPGEQLGEGEGLDQVVVGAGVEPSTRSSMASRAVSISTGVSSPAARIRRHTSRPSMPGSPMSSTGVRRTDGDLLQGLGPSPARVTS